MLGDSEESPTKSKKRPGASDLDAIAEARSQHMVIAVDSVFANSSKLDADAIVDFVKYLIINSTEEIEHAAGAENLRLYSLQRLVEISHYNMNRIRLEWSRIWSMLGEHFNQVRIRFFWQSFVTNVFVDRLDAAPTSTLSFSRWIRFGSFR